MCISHFCPLLNFFDQMHLEMHGLILHSSDDSINLQSWPPLFNSNGAKNQPKSEMYSSILMIALCYIVATTVIPFRLGHLKIFSSNGAKMFLESTKITHSRLGEAFVIIFSPIRGLYSKKNQGWPNLKTILLSLLTFIGL